jgi:hypothetical protein
VDGDEASGEEPRLTGPAKTRLIRLPANAARLDLRHYTPLSFTSWQEQPTGQAQ